MAYYRSQTTIASQEPDLSGTFTTATSAPASPTVGQRWYKSDTGVTYQYTNDGTSSFWLDISSGGIGTSLSRSVDYVGDTDPIATTNGAGLVAGKIYYNRESHNYFTCIDPTNNANIWASEFIPVGGRIQEYTSGGNSYRSHSFLKTGVFYADAAMTGVDILVVGGGGGSGTGRGGGGGGGGLVTHTNQSIAAGSHTVTVGAGGAKNGDGGDSQFASLTAGGGGGAGGSGANDNGNAGRSPNGSAGGGGADSGTGGVGPGSGNDGGNAFSGNSSTAAGAGGGGAGGDGVSAASANGGDGGAGVANAYQTGVNQTYSRGGHGGQNAIYWGDPAGSRRSMGDDTFRKSPHGEGGSSDDGGSGGHLGYTGIVVVRYQI